MKKKTEKKRTQKKGVKKTLALVIHFVMKISRYFRKINLWTA